jgi:quinohemoprotein ethanol dehydrogenase
MTDGPPVTARRSGVPASRGASPANEGAKGHREARSSRRGTARRAAVTGGLALALLPVAESLAQHRDIPPAPAFRGDALVAPPTTGWATNGGDWYNRRHSPLTQIDRSNVAELKGVWRARLDGSGVGPQYSGEAQPLVYAGVLYVVTGANDVFAIDVESGETLWKYEADLDPAIGSVICCGWTSRGVGLGDGRVYVGQLDGKLLALDQRTGETLWAVQAERWQEGYTITSAPLYYDGLVITGFAGAEYGVRGRVKAYDATDGSLAWAFYTIPGPGELGHDTWPADSEVWRHGGATVWHTPALDPELGLIYFSTGNPGPDYNGAVRAGDNLFSSSIVALDVATGEHRWHFQQVHHDIWDYDSPNPVVLFDLEVGGVPRKGLAQASKTGWVYILDRTNGEPLIGIEERPVPQEPRQATSPTQPFPAGDAFVPQSIDIPPEGYRLINGGRIFTPFWTEEAVVLKPWALGGANWPPSAYDPETGYLYVCAQDHIGAFRAEETSDLPEPGAMYTGGPFLGVPLPRYGIFAALDMRTNRLVWQQHWPEPCYSGAVTTAGGLVFVGRNDGRLTALDASDGARLWEFQTGAGMNAPVTVFEHGGRQLVAAYSAGNLFAGSARGDSVWLFALDGALGPAEPAGTLMSLPRGLEDAADLDNGLAVYQAACTFCHGDDGAGGHGGGPAFFGALTLGAVIQVVSEGRNDMPAFGPALSSEQVRDVSAYVLALERP